MKKSPATPDCRILSHSQANKTNSSDVNPLAPEHESISDFQNEELITAKAMEIKKAILDFNDRLFGNFTY